MRMIIRNNCCICNGDTDYICEFENYPIRFDMVLNTNYQFQTLKFMICRDCNNIQLNNLINIEDLYSNKPHNNNIIGETWKQHFISYAKFMNTINNNLMDVLEIGSPNDKILTHINDYNTWTLLDPNAQIFNISNIISMKAYFNETFDTSKKYTTIISSHLIEHLYNPSQQIARMNECLTEEGDLFISVPNMEYYSKTHTPFLGIHFEHTYYLNTVNMIYILNKNQFEVINYEYYNNHSIFYHCKKNKHMKLSLDSVKQYNIVNLQLFHDKIGYFKTLITDINRSILHTNRPVYLYGCHTNSQILIYLGINTTNIKYILDNDTSKHDKYFYGTGLLCKSPEVIKEIESPIVICYIGNYSQEVKTQLLGINNQVVFV